MRTLTDREKRTVRIAAIGMAIYLVLFFGFRVWNYLDRGRHEYLQLVTDARGLRQQLLLYQDKALAAQKLMAGFHLDPARLTKATVVAKASAAIQKAATGSGIQLGPLRESPARPATRELAQMQLEAIGPLPALLALLHRLDSLGYPLVVDAIQIGSDSSRPGPIKLSLTILILDYEQWRKEALPNA
jgi:hypothetical protein